MWKFYADADYGGDSFTQIEGTFDDPSSQFGSVGDNSITSVAVFGKKIQFPLNR